MKDDKTNGRRVANLKRCVVVVCISVPLFLVCGPRSFLIAQDDISVSRDKDKTVYSIDSNDDNRQQQERERDKAWDMLKNMPIIIDGRQGQSMPVRPGSAQPVQPAPGK